MWRVKLLYCPRHLYFAVVSCGTPPVFAGTKASLALGYYGDNLTFTCADDLVHVGGGTGRMTCDVTGVWELDGHDTPPLCLGNNLVTTVSSRSRDACVFGGHVVAATHLKLPFIVTLYICTSHHILMLLYFDYFCFSFGLQGTFSIL